MAAVPGITGVERLGGLPFLLRLPVPLAVMAGIWTASSFSHVEMPFEFSFQDKVLHFLAYLGLSAAWWFALANRIPKLKLYRCIVISALFASAYGASDEIHQYFVPGRFCTWGDFLADSMGAFFVAGLAPVVRRLRKNG